MLFIVYVNVREIWKSKERTPRQRGAKDEEKKTSKQANNTDTIGDDIKFT